MREKLNLNETFTFGTDNTLARESVFVTAP